MSRPNEFSKKLDVLQKSLDRFYNNPWEIPGGTANFNLTSISEIRVGKECGTYTPDATIRGRLDYKDGNRAGSFVYQAKACHPYDIIIITIYESVYPNIRSVGQILISTYGVDSDVKATQFKNGNRGKTFKESSKI